MDETIRYEDGSEGSLRQTWSNTQSIEATPYRFHPLSNGRRDNTEPTTVNMQQDKSGSRDSFLLPFPPSFTPEYHQPINNNFMPWPTNYNWGYSDMNNYYHDGSYVGYRSWDPVYNCDTGYPNQQQMQIPQERQFYPYSSNQPNIAPINPLNSKSSVVADKKTWTLVKTITNDEFRFNSTVVTQTENNKAPTAAVRDKSEQEWNRNVHKIDVSRADDDDDDLIFLEIVNKHDLKKDVEVITISDDEVEKDDTEGD